MRYETRNATLTHITLAFLIASIASSCGFRKVIVAGSSNKPLESTGNAPRPPGENIVTDSDDIKFRKVNVPKLASQVKGTRVVGCVFGPLADLATNPVMCTLYAVTNAGEVLEIPDSRVVSSGSGTCRAEALSSVPPSFQRDPQCIPFLGFLRTGESGELVFADRGENLPADLAGNPKSSKKGNAPKDALGLATAVQSMPPDPVSEANQACGYKNQFPSMAACLEAQANCMRTGWIYTTGCNYYCDGAPSGILSGSYKKCERPASATGLSAEPEAFNYGLISTAGQGVYHFADGFIKLPANALASIGEMVSNVGQSVSTCTLGGADSWYNYGVACLVTGGVAVGVTVGAILMLPAAPPAAIVAGATAIGTGMAAIGTAVEAGKTLYIALNPNQSIAEQIAAMEKQNGSNLVALAGNLLTYWAAIRNPTAPTTTINGEKMTQINLKDALPAGKAFDNPGVIQGMSNAAEGGLPVLTNRIPDVSHYATYAQDLAKSSSLKDVIKAMTAYATKPDGTLRYDPKTIATLAGEMWDRLQEISAAKNGGFFYIGSSNSEWVNLLNLDPKTTGLLKAILRTTQPWDTFTPAEQAAFIDLVNGPLAGILREIKIPVKVAPGSTLGSGPTGEGIIDPTTGLLVASPRVLLDELRALLNLGYTVWKNVAGEIVLVPPI
ncbi:MAG: hypothetical protein RIQ81_1437 [Pseudomonadota bacterium]